MSTNPTPDDASDWQPGDFMAQLGTKRLAENVAMLGERHRTGRGWLLAGDPSGYVIVPGEMPWWVKLTRENVVAVLFGEEPPPAAPTSFGVIMPMDAEPISTDLTERIRRALADSIVNVRTDHGRALCDLLPVSGALLAEALNAIEAGGEVPVPAAPEAPERIDITVWPRTGMVDAHAHDDEHGDDPPIPFGYGLSVEKAYTQLDVARAEIAELRAMLRKVSPCSECGGTGEATDKGHTPVWDDGRMEFPDCEACDGAGFVRGAAPVPAAQPDTAAELLRIADTHPCAPCARDLRLLAAALSAPVDPPAGDETSAT